jgi:hypothetical protein
LVKPVRFCSAPVVPFEMRVQRTIRIARLFDDILRMQLAAVPKPDRIEGLADLLRARTFGPA